MILRAATGADIPAILAIWNPLIRDTAVTFTTEEKTPQALAAEIAARGAAFIVAEAAGSMPGFAAFGPVRPGPGYRLSRGHRLSPRRPSARGGPQVRALDGSGAVGQASLTLCPDRRIDPR